ncbi:MAG: HEAT repeat domain-containing protein [Ilumatobacteraceae bacterium]|nr:HEAT repeat domain-containing protein [Ilumatobacteraceae bacterium]
MTSQQRWRDLVIAGHEGDEPAARVALGQADPVARQLALGALARMRALTDDDLRAAFNDPAATVRHRAATLAATHPEVSVLVLLRDEETTVVEAAAWTAGEQELVDDDVLLLLCELGASAPDPLVREASVAALGAIGDERGLPVILNACTDKPNIRRRAVLALAPFSGAEVDAALAAALSDRDWQVRQAAEDLAPHMDIGVAGDLENS